MSMLLAELLAPWTTRKLPILSIQSLCLDSREARPGCLFFAVKGSTQDGRAYVADAIEKGAVAILVDSEMVLTQAVSVCVVSIPSLQQHIGYISERFYQYPSESLTMYGVTGTNGKTSITYYLAQALTTLGCAAGVIGTTGNGLWPTLEASALTTPSPVELAGLLAGFVNQGALAAAMEVSSHALAQYRADGIRFDTAIFTNFTHDHLDYHETMQAYALAKQRLFDFPDLRYRIFNIDDPMGQRWAKAYHGVTTYTYGLSPDDNPRHTYVTDITYDETGMDMMLCSPWYRGPLRLNLLGQFNIQNVLAVFVALCIHPYVASQVIKALATLKGAPGRMQCIRRPRQALVVVDYAHTPDALSNALQALRLHVQGKLWCVFGCGGDRDKTKRPLMAQIAAQYADNVVVTSDNPRKEDPREIIAEICTGFSNGTSYTKEVDRTQAIHLVLSRAKANDIILIAGKGHEDYQDIGGVQIPYQDAIVVEQYDAASIL